MSGARPITHAGRPNEEIMARLARPRLGFVLLGAILAALALVNIIGVSGWHGAISDHDDRIVMTDLLEHDEGEPSAPDVDLHKTTHAVIYGMTDAAPQIGPVTRLLATAILWSPAAYANRRGILAEGPLRPPRI